MDRASDASCGIPGWPGLHRNLHVLQCVIRVVEKHRYRRVISAVNNVPSVLSETVLYPAPSLSNVDSRWTFVAC